MVSRVKFSVEANVRPDAWNVWDSCNSKSHGVDWSKNAGPKLRKYVVGKTRVEAYKWLLPFLKKYHKEIGLKQTAKKLGAELCPIWPRLIEILERITGRQLYQKEITFFLTTYSRCPYNMRKGYVWLIAHKGLDWQISTILHELLHFQFIHYWGKEVHKQITNKQFEALKEAMVVILNDYLKGLSTEKEETYLIYRKLGRELLKLWHKSGEDFDKFVGMGAEAVKKYDF